MNKLPRIVSNLPFRLPAPQAWALSSLALLLVIGAGAAPAGAQNWEGDDWLHSVRPGDSYKSVCAEFVDRPSQYCTRNLPFHNPELLSLEIQQADDLPQGSQVKIPLNWLLAPPVPAEVEMVRGDAFFEQRLPDGYETQADGGTEVLRNFGPRQPLKAGTQLATGDRIVTEKGNVLLRFADQSSFLMKSNSELELERMTAHGATGMVDTHMRLKRGSGRARVNSDSGKTRYRITTPVAIAAARGTDFSISAELPADGSPVVMHNEVLEGLVTVTRGSEGGPLVASGFGTVAKAGEAISEPIALLPASKVTVKEKTELPLTLQWSDVADAKEYALDIFEGLDGSGGLVSSKRLEQSEADLVDLDAGDYSFVVRAVDEHGLRGLEASANTSAEIDLPVPKWNRSALKVNGDEVQLSWSPIRFADSYQLEVSDSAEFDNIVHTASVEQASTTITLPAGPKYYARVKAEYSHYGAGAYSSAQALNEAEGPRSWWLILLGILAVAV